MTKNSILFCPGPEYLFWAMGIYYVWELSRHYRVILVLDFLFERSEKLDELKGRGILHDYVPLPSYRDSFFGFQKVYQRHKHFFGISRTQFEKHHPVVAIIQHTDLEPANIYLFEEAESKKIVRIIYRPSKIPNNYFDDYLLMREWILTQIRRKWSIPHWLAFLYFGFKKVVSYYLNYWILPFLFKKHIFKPRIDAVSKRNSFINHHRGYFDWILAYSEREKSITFSNGEPSTVIKNPIKTVGDDANEYLYGSIALRDEILILPSNGEIDCIRKREGISNDEVVKCYYEKWSRAIDIIQKKFPTYALCMKLHPSQSADTLFQNVVRLMRKNNKHLKVLSPEERAEKLILGARVVVSTCSSVLWWANQLHSEKILISINCFHIPEGDAFSEVEGINYFDDLQKLADHDFSHTSTTNKAGTTIPTLTDFMQTHVNL